ncbi:MAG: PhzF family phenazine biosynthesis protein [Phycisphaerales bacterium JB037]
MTTAPIVQADSFTSRTFHGNPAAVVPLEFWLDAGAMQAIALENNLSETAFVVRGGRDGTDYHLRWFTPAREVALCGHATLAAAHALMNHFGFRGDKVSFSTERAGILTVHKLTTGNLASGQPGRYRMDFPATPREPVEVTTDLVRALGRQPVEAFAAGEKLMAVFDSKKDVHAIEPDFAAIAALPHLGIICTAPGVGHDFVSRFFAPAAGVPEDPVTGSAHCVMAPYWAERLGKSELTAHQVSQRGGEVHCKVEADRVHLTGACVTYLEGTIRIPAPEAEHAA